MIIHQDLKMFGNKLNKEVYFHSLEDVGGGRSIAQ